MTAVGSFVNDRNSSSAVQSKFTRKATINTMREGTFTKSRLRRNKTTFINSRTSIKSSRTSTLNILNKNMHDIRQVLNKEADLIQNFEHIAENTKESGSIRPYTKASSVLDLESMNNIIQTPIYNMRVVSNN